MGVCEDWIRVGIGIGVLDGGGHVGVGEEFVGWGLGLG